MLEKPTLKNQTEGTSDIQKLGIEKQALKN